MNNLTKISYLKELLNLLSNEDIENIYYSNKEYCILSPIIFNSGVVVNYQLVNDLSKEDFNEIDIICLTSELINLIVLI